MIVPTFWAEARLRERTRERQVTVRRFGWADTSLEDAQAHADERAREALARILAGDRTLHRRDRKVAYNGAEGIPIREEIVERAGSMVVTRNAYGARCLNVPDVLFADIDLATPGSVGLGALAVLVCIAIALRWTHGAGWSIQLAVAGLAALAASLVLAVLDHFRKKLQARWADRVPRRLRSFVAKNPEWHLRLYRTPAGYRVLAMQRTFSPGEPAVAAAFKAWGADQVYVLMCRNQQCFRARLTAKPWRIGIDDHLKPRPGIWPVQPEHLPARARWVARYEEAAGHFAACRFEESIGSGAVVAETEAVRVAHDRWCRAESGLPLA